MQTIYIDVLLCINLIINLLLLSASAFYLHESITVKRLLLGSSVGAVGGLAILLPTIPFAADVILKAAICAASVIAAFGFGSKRRFIKLCAVFLTVTFFFGGCVAAIWFLLTPKNLTVKNGVVYINISPLMLIMITAICYGAFRLFCTLSGRYKTDRTSCFLTLRGGSNVIAVPAMIDTGNTLSEPFSQCPVIVIGRKTARDITPAAIKEYETVTTLRYRTEAAGVRFVPFSSVGGKGVMPCFKADEVMIDNRVCTMCVYVALCDDSMIEGEYRALVPREIV